MQAPCTSHRVEFNQRPIRPQELALLLTVAGAYSHNEGRSWLRRAARVPHMLMSNAIKSDSSFGMVASCAEGGSTACVCVCVCVCGGGGGAGLTHRHDALTASRFVSHACLPDLCVWCLCRLVHVHDDLARCLPSQACVHVVSALVSQWQPPKRAAPAKTTLVKRLHPLSHPSTESCSEHVIVAHEDERTRAPFDMM
jgi:hypothetical protein